MIARFPATKILWTVQPHVNQHVLQVLNVSWSGLLTNAAIDTYNQNAESVLFNLANNYPDQMIMWSSLSRISEMTLDQMPRGILLPDKVIDQGVSVRSNLSQYFVQNAKSLRQKVWQLRYCFR